MSNDTDKIDADNHSPLMRDLITEFKIATCIW